MEKFENMNIGILKEQSDENRVAMLPETVKKLIRKNVSVFVEAGVGILAYAIDEDYVQAGAEIKNKDEIKDPHNLRLIVRVNGETVQDATTEEMVFNVPEVIEFISGYVTLDPGDIIATGTPGGSKGALKNGDKVEVEISNIGVLASIVE